MYNFNFSCNWTTKIKTNNEIFGSMKNLHWKISFARYTYGENISCIYYRMTATHKSVQWLKHAGTYANLLIIDRSKRHEKFLTNNQIYRDAFWRACFFQLNFPNKVRKRGWTRRKIVCKVTCLIYLFIYLFL